MHMSMSEYRALERQRMLDEELKIMRMLAEGRERDDIALEMNYSIHTLKNKLTTLRRRRRAKNTLHAVAIAIRAGEI